MESTTSKTKKAASVVQEPEEKSPELQLHEAIINVMSEVNYLQKDDTVGTGASSYKGISDEKVRETIRKSMIVHGLYCMPVKIEKQTNVERWQEPDPYKKDVIKTKQQVFTDIVFTFRVYHISGAYIEGVSNGHGIDSQDKAPGKAMTYAMKYFLLNLFMIPTGEDPDKIHSSQIEIPKTLDERNAEKKAESKVEGEKHTPLHKTYPAEADIESNLFGGKGIIGLDIFEGIISNWTKNGAALLYGKYIYTVKDGNYNYFKLDLPHQLNKIEKLIKYRHG
jgi:hypothetical protein